MFGIALYCILNISTTSIAITTLRSSSSTLGVIVLCSVHTSLLLLFLLGFLMRRLLPVYPTEREVLQRSRVNAMSSLILRLLGAGFFILAAGLIGSFVGDTLDLQTRLDEDDVSGATFGITVAGPVAYYLFCHFALSLITFNRLRLITSLALAIAVGVYAFAMAAPWLVLLGLPRPSGPDADAVHITMTIMVGATALLSTLAYVVFVSLSGKQRGYALRSALDDTSVTTTSTQETPPSFTDNTIVDNERVPRSVISILQPPDSPDQSDASTEPSPAIPESMQVYCASCGQSFVGQMRPDGTCPLCWRPVSP